MTGLNATRPLRYLIAALMLFLVVPVAMAERQPLDRVVAVVDEGVVLQSELQARLQQIESRLRAQGTRLPRRRSCANGCWIS